MEIIRRKTVNTLVIGRHSIIMTDKDLAQLHDLIEKYMDAGVPHKDRLNLRCLASAYDTTIGKDLLCSMEIGQQISRPAMAVNRTSVRCLASWIKRKYGMGFTTKTNRTTGTFSVKRIK